MTSLKLRGREFDDVIFLCFALRVVLRGTDRRDKYNYMLYDTNTTKVNIKDSFCMGNIAKQLKTFTVSLY